MSIAPLPSPFTQKPTPSDGAQSFGFANLSAACAHVFSRVFERFTAARRMQSPRPFSATDETEAEIFRSDVLTAIAAASAPSTTGIADGSSYGALPPRT